MRPDAHLTLYRMEHARRAAKHERRARPNASSPRTATVSRVVTAAAATCAAGGPRRCDVLLSTRCCGRSHHTDPACGAAHVGADSGPASPHDPNPPALW